MNVYRCYFLNAANRIEAAEDLDAETLSEAVERAQSMLQSRPQHRAIELWEGARRVYPTNPPPVQLRP